MIRIIHLSDFHLSSQNRSDWKNFVKTPFLEKICELNEGTPITLITNTGDMLDKGGKDFSSYEEAFRIFREEVTEQIVTKAGLPINKFLMVPGNHDIVRDRIDEVMELGYQAYFAKDYLNVGRYMDSVINNGKTQGLERILDYKSIEKEFYPENSNVKITPFESSFIFEESKGKIGVSCLNSSWRSCGNSDQGALIIGENQVARSLEFLNDCKIKIALIHHPIDWMIETDKEKVANYIAKDYNVLLTGHVHKGATSLTTNFIGTLFTNVAPTGINDIRSDSRSYANGFSVIDFDFDFDEVSVTFFRYNHESKSFVLNSDLIEDGHLHISIPKKLSNTENTSIEKILLNINEDHSQTMDDHLIYTKANKGNENLKDAFIFPPIDQGGLSPDEPDPIVNNISTIAKSTSDLLFFGSPESGKTVLLYRLTREYVDEYNLLRKVPAYFDFESLGNRRIETEVKSYLRCSTDEVNMLLSTGRLVLLIDNLNFNKDYNIDAILKLNRLKSQYEGVRIIATADEKYFSVPGLNYIEICTIPFKNFFIRPLRSGHIKKLIVRWNPEGYKDEPDEFVDDLIDKFRSYSLPSTAMSVSLYLWSLENKDKKPINHAVLLEIYVEIILEKLGEFNIYREKFDFTNKMQLLAKIAYDMYIKDEIDYSVTYSEFVKIIEVYLEELVGFDFDAGKIAEYFFDRRIFVRIRSNRVKFAFSCFFHFFLSKRMIFDKEFKEFVLNTDNFYLFTEELDYYTALTRSDKELLKLTLERFENDFSSVKDILENIDLDKYFTYDGRETFEPKVKQLEIGKLNESRPSTELIEEFQNRRLKEIPDPDQILKKENRKSLELSLILMSKVLRNSEGVEDIGLKKRGYDSVLKYGLIWMVLYKEYIIQYVIQNQRYPYPIPSELDLRYVLRTVPYHCQLGLTYHLGTPKLSPIIQDKIIESMKEKTSSISDVELFLSVCLYSDIKGRDFQKHLKNLIKRVGNNAVRDYLMYKIIRYFHRRTKPGSANEKEYLELLVDLKMKTEKLPARMRQKVARSFKSLAEKRDQEKDND